MDSSYGSSSSSTTMYALTAQNHLAIDTEMSTVSLNSQSKRGRGRKRDDSLPYNRARDVQRAFRARRAAHLEALEERVQDLEEENLRLRAELSLPPAQRPALGKGPTGRGTKLIPSGTSPSATDSPPNHMRQRSISNPLNFASYVPIDHPSPITNSTSNSNSPSPSSVVSARKKLWTAWDSPSSVQTLPSPQAEFNSKMSLLGLEHSQEQQPYHSSSSHPHLTNPSASYPTLNQFRPPHPSPPITGQDPSGSYPNLHSQSQTASPNYALQSIHERGEPTTYGAAGHVASGNSIGHSHSYSYPPEDHPNSVYTHLQPQQHQSRVESGSGNFHAFPKRESFDESRDHGPSATSGSLGYQSRRPYPTSSHDQYLYMTPSSTSNSIARTLASNSHIRVPSPPISGGQALHIRAHHQHHYSTG